jgi:hypothetical protein
VASLRAALKGACRRVACGGACVCDGCAGDATAGCGFPVFRCSSAKQSQSFASTRPLLTARVKAFFCKRQHRHLLPTMRPLTPPTACHPQPAAATGRDLALDDALTRLRAAEDALARCGATLVGRAPPRPSSYGWPTQPAPLPARKVAGRPAAAASVAPIAPPPHPRPPRLAVDAHRASEAAAEKLCALAAERDDLQVGGRDTMQGPPGKLVGSWKPGSRPVVASRQAAG